MLTLLSFWKYISGGLSILKAKKDLVAGYNQFSKWVSEEDFLDVNELTRFFRMGKVPYGTVVNLEGILTEYGHTYHPYTYMPTMPEAASKRYVGNNTFQLNTRIGMFQPPVEVLPPINFEGKSFKLGFIYPNEFTGFEYEPRFKSVEEAIVAKKPYFHIPESAKPIPLLYKSDLSIFTGDKYKIKARVVELPTEQLFLLNKHLDGFSWDVYDKAFDLLSLDKKTLCLMVDGESTTMKKADIFSIDRFPATFFVEGHLDTQDLPSDPRQIINRAIPYLFDKDAPVNSFSFMPYKEQTCFLTQGNVRIFLRGSSVVGFYVSLDLSDEQSYRDAITELGDNIQRFDRNFQNITQSLIGKRIKLQIDFISDVRLAAQFGLLNRLLQSNEIHKYFEKHPEYMDIMGWASGRDL